MLSGDFSYPSLQFFPIETKFLFLKKISLKTGRGRETTGKTACFLWNPLFLYSITNSRTIKMLLIIKIKNLRLFYSAPGWWQGWLVTSFVWKTMQTIEGMTSHHFHMTKIGSTCIISHLYFPLLPLDPNEGGIRHPYFQLLVHTPLVCAETFPLKILGPSLSSGMSNNVSFF